MSEKIPVTRSLLDASSTSVDLLQFTAEQFAILGLPHHPEPGWVAKALSRELTQAQVDQLLAIGKRRREILADKRRRASTSLFD